MSAIGLPMADHVQPHFSGDGLCQCPCDECTLRLTRACVCEYCACESQEDHQSAGDGDLPEWIAVPFGPGADGADSTVTLT
jgi:hypothetical protein